MASPTALQHILGYDQETGAYHKAHMLVRLAQMAVMGDRGITQADIARKIERSPEAVSRYFLGSYFMKSLKHPNYTEPEEDTFARIRAYEDKVERAIEELVAERGLSPALSVGTSTEKYINQEVIYPELMKP